ncbi:hypothetical protein DAKH74_035330 [Maudiozyma humilis]|uniref:N-acetyltransferase domain-containing protein n=1 Tax=Maudiozyma humilis TaxID=51915 RepID=A0AAV5S1T4_MAUHU|nr:hypothetical protein DAKH74_035330 [Kazachstania humilis]
MKEGCPVYIRDVNGETTAQFCRLANSVLGTQYPPESFEAAPRGHHLLYICKVAVVHGEVVGGIRAHSVADGSSSIVPSAMYIDMLAVSPVWQHQGIGSILLEQVELLCRECYVHVLQLHTPVNNTAAIRWYVDRHSFVEGDVVPDFYLSTPMEAGRLSRDAVLLSRVME